MRTWSLNLVRSRMYACPDIRQNYILKLKALPENRERLIIFFNFLIHTDPTVKTYKGKNAYLYLCIIVIIMGATEFVGSTDPADPNMGPPLLVEYEYLS